MVDSGGLENRLSLKWVHGFESHPLRLADMVELEDTPDLGSGAFSIRVRVPLSALRAGQKASHWAHNPEIPGSNPGLRYCVRILKRLYEHCLEDNCGLGHEGSNPSPNVNNCRFFCFYF